MTKRKRKIDSDIERLAKTERDFESKYRAAKSSRVTLEMERAKLDFGVEVGCTVKGERSTWGGVGKRKTLRGTYKVIRVRVSPEPGIKPRVTGKTIKKDGSLGRNWIELGDRWEVIEDDGAGKK